MYISVDKWGSSILHRFVDSHGRDCKENIKNFRPDLFVAASDGEFTAMNDSSIRLTRIECDSFDDAKETIERYEGDVYGQNNWSLNAIAKLYEGQQIKTDFSKIRVAIYDLEVMSDDGFPSPIQAAKEIVSISHYDSILDKIFLWSLKPWDSAKSVLNGMFAGLLEKVEFIHCHSERELLRRYVEFWRINTPMILSGWNTEGFDDPYLFNRVSLVLGETTAKSLSPFQAVTKREVKDRFGMLKVEVNFLGIAQLDLQRLYQKFEVKAAENYRLETIASMELGTTKIDYINEETLQNLYESDPQKFNDYNILDTWLVWLIEGKRQFIRLALFLAHTAKVNLQDVFSPVRTWDNLVYTFLLEKHRVPALGTRSFKEPYAGAYVKPVVPGMYRWVVSFDVASLYPSIIRQWNMCPSTVLDHPSVTRGDYVSNFIKQTSIADNIISTAVPDTCIAVNSVLFDTSKEGVLPILTTILFNERKVTKKKAIELMQEAEKFKAIDHEKYDQLKLESAGFKTKEGAIKVLLNSLYGAMANEYYRFYDIRIAEAITLNGQFIIQFIEQAINKFLHKILGGEYKDRCIAIDTDSVYFNLSDLVDKIQAKTSMTIEETVNFLDKACEKIQNSAIIPSIEELTKYTRCSSRIVDMKREAICDLGFWTAKKRYALNVHDNEGVRYAEPEQKVMGLELVKSSTPKFCRSALKEAVKIILTGDPTDRERLVEFIAKTKVEFFKLPIYDLSYPRSVNEIDKWTTATGEPAKSCPINVRAAIVYNNELRRRGLDSSYQIIKPGSKIRFVELLEPNPLRSHVVGFYTRLPTEFGLERYIDREAMFQSTFLKPLKDICDVINLLTEPDNSIGDFFS